MRSFTGERNKLRWRCDYRSGGNRVYCYSSISPQGEQRDRAGRRPKRLVLKRKLRGVQRYIITAAQNATPVHRPFLAALHRACRHLNAELLVIPLRYKNPTSRWTQSQANEEIWSKHLDKYLWNQRLPLNRNLTLLADIKTQPTASSPLTGYDAITGLSSGILGHTKLQQRCIPTPQNKMAKILTTTGVCTVPNYTDSRAGKLGEFHHSLSALIVEVKGKIFHLRQLIADRDGSFIDLDKLYTPAKGGLPAQRPTALVMGDTHVDFIDKAVKRATFGKGGIIQTLKPTALVWHDLLDAYSVNPHHRGNPFNALAKRIGGMDDARAEVIRAVKFIDENTPKGTESIVVASNHDDMLRRWIVNSDWKMDPINAAFYLETALAMVKGTTLTDTGTSYPSPFPYWVEKLSTIDPIILGGSESLMVNGIEVGMHGDQGPSGARGSIKNLRRIGVKSFIAHGHSPGIDEGCWQVGTSTPLRLEYNSGPGAWLNTHGLIHANGKRQLINIINGAWRL